MVAELEGAGQSPPLTQLPPILLSLSHVSRTTHTHPTSHPRSDATSTHCKPIGKLLWDQGQAIHQRLCHHSMTYTKPDSEWTKTQYLLELLWKPNS